MNTFVPMYVFIKTMIFYGSSFCLHFYSCGLCDYMDNQACIGNFVLLLGCLAELTTSRQLRMPKMVPRNCFSFMVVTQAKYPISRGTHVKIGLLLVLLKITFFRSGRWQRTSTMMKTIYQRNPQRLLSVIVPFYQVGEIEQSEKE